MAAPGSFYELTLPEFIKGINDAVIQDVALLDYAESNGCMKKGSGGDGGEFRVRATLANIGGVVTDFDTGNAKTINPFIKLVYAFRPYLWKLYINALQEDRHNNAPAGSQIADMQQEQLNVIQQEATQRYGVHFYGDGTTLSTGDVTGATPVEGLESNIDSTGTYFGKSRTTYPNLASQETSCTNPSAWDNGQVNNLVVAMDTNYLACSGGMSNGTSISKSVATAKDEPDAIFTTSTLFNIFRQSFYPQQLYTGTKNDPVKELAYGKAMMRWDSFCTANRMYFTNKKHMVIKVVGSGLVRMMKTIDALNPLGTIHVVGGQAQFYLTDPRKFGKIVSTGS